MHKSPAVVQCAIDLIEKVKAIQFIMLVIRLFRAYLPQWTEAHSEASQIKSQR